MRDSILTSADILSLIDFDGPVVTTLHQVMERYDGTGVPEGTERREYSFDRTYRDGRQCLCGAGQPASAHRPNLEQKEAVANLMRDADKTYDSRVVTALGHVIENRRDKLDWLSSSKSQ